MSKPLSKLSQIHRALKNNPEIIFEVIPSHRLSGEFTCCSQVIYFFVAPKTKLKTIKELQEFMLSLIPDLKPTRLDNFHEDRNEMYFGRLYFDEIIGEEYVYQRVTLTDTDMFPLDGFVGNKLTIRRTNKVRRLITVKVFPDEKTAKSAMDGGGENRTQTRKGKR